MSYKDKILIIDDNKAIIEVLELILSNRFEVASTSNLEEAYHKIDVFQPSIILLDILLGGMYYSTNNNGKAFCKQIKGSSAAKNIKVILMSGYEFDTSLIKDCLADDFLAKPFNEEQLLDKLSK